MARELSQFWFLAGAAKDEVRRASTFYRKKPPSARSSVFLNLSTIERKSSLFAAYSLG
jgi:hypothetical protein